MAPLVDADEPIARYSSGGVIGNDVRRGWITGVVGSRNLQAHVTHGMNGNGCQVVRKN